MRYGSLRSLESREQKKEAPSFPAFDPVQDGSLCPLGTAFTAGMSVLGRPCRVETVKRRCFSYS